MNSGTLHLTMVAGKVVYLKFFFTSVKIFMVNSRLADQISYLYLIRSRPYIINVSYCGVAHDFRSRNLLLFLEVNVKLVIDDHCC